MTRGARRAPRAGAALLLVAGLALGAGGDPPSLRVAPSATGRLGAWLVAGPYRPGAGAAPPVGVDERALAPRAGAPFGPPFAPRKGGGTGKAPTWILTGGDGPVDMKAALGASEADVVGYAAGVLRVAKGGKRFLALGVDDGVTVLLDGRAVFTRDEPRALRDDDDLVPLELAPGDHTLALRLHQRDGAWVFRARLVDATFGPAPDVELVLPGPPADEARALAARMARAAVDRGVHAGGYAPEVTARFPEGSPRGAALPVRARIRPAKDGDAVPFVALGDLAPGGELRAPIAAPSPDALEGAPHAVDVEIGPRLHSFPFLARARVRDALAHAEAALRAQAGPAPGARVPPGTLATLAHLRNRLARLASRGDDDADAAAAEARELGAVADDVLRGRDPYPARTGASRRAYVSPADGELHEYALYVPPSYRPAQRRPLPLVVALHGLHGTPMAMLRWFFGGDDPGRDTAWEDRHPDPLPDLDAIVLAPSGHGDAMYRDLGEDDVLRLVALVRASYPIDEARITITGPSMGGIGAAALPLRHPFFAAAAPLCGYHSYLIRPGLRERLRPWERPLAEARSNVFWAWNGKDLPLYVVHGTLDTPEANSGVLIERYEELGYSVRHEHPKLGHNVWQPTYANLEGARWLLAQTRDPHPREVRFRTVDLRAADSAWVHVEELAAPGTWGEIEARVAARDVVEARTTGLAAVRFDRDARLVDPEGPVTLRIDGARVLVPRGAPLAAHVGSRGWEAGPPVHDGPHKRAGLAGPFRDVFHEPLLFVWGDAEPDEARVNREVARAFAEVRPGVTVRYPLVSDTEFLARGEPLANDRALFLVGGPRSNRVTRALMPDLPARVEDGAVVLGAARYTGPEIGVAFVHPNPRRPDRYVAIVAGATALGTFRALSLPDLLPDFTVYDEKVAPSRGSLVLGAGQVRAAGFFANDWALPASAAPRAPR